MREPYRTFPLPDFNGEPARGIIDPMPDFPRVLELSLQVQRRSRWRKKPRWVTLDHCIFELRNRMEDQSAEDYAVELLNLMMNDVQQVLDEQLELQRFLEGEQA